MKMHDNMNDAMQHLRQPAPALPAGAWDVHAHVFGPYDRFPLAQGTPYTPPLAPYEHYTEMLDKVGFAHGVVVHAGANGFDNSGMIDALRRSAGRLRGIAVTPIDTPDAALADMAAAGVRGLRFTDNGMPKPPVGVLDLDELRQVAPRLKELGWHAVLFAKADVVAARADELRQLGVPLVLDHMGLFDVDKGLDDAGFRAIVELAREGVAWVKLTALRVSRQSGAMADVRPYHQALIEAAPDQMLWGSDWPFIGFGDALPNNAALIELAHEWMADSDLFQRIFATNPARLYQR